MGETFDMATARNMTTNPARPPLAGHRPLFAGEDAAAYDSLLGRVSDVVKPADVLEEIWLQDVVDLSWEVGKLRRMKAEFLNRARIGDCARCWMGCWAGRKADHRAVDGQGTGGRQARASSIQGRGHEDEYGDGADARCGDQRSRADRSSHRCRRAGAATRCCAKSPITGRCLPPICGAQPPTSKTPSSRSSASQPALPAEGTA